MTLTLIYPSQVDNGYKKYYFCYRLQQRLQEIHCEWAEKLATGKITRAKFRQFVDTWYDPRDMLVSNEILRLRKLAKNKNWNVNLNNVFVEA